MTPIIDDDCAGNLAPAEQLLFQPGYEVGDAGVDAGEVGLGALVSVRDHAYLVEVEWVAVVFYKLEKMVYRIRG